MAKKADYIGFCGYCGRGPFHLSHGTNRLVDHGYTMHWGCRSGRCGGVGLLPVELSNETYIQLAEDLTSEIQREHGVLKKVATAKILKETKTVWRDRKNVSEEFEYHEGSDKFRWLQEDLIRQSERNIEGLEKYLAAAEEAIRNWKPAEFLYEAKHYEAQERAKKSSERDQKKTDKIKRDTEKAVASIERLSKSFLSPKGQYLHYVSLAKERITTHGEAEYLRVLGLLLGCHTLDDIARKLDLLERMGVKDFDAEYLPKVLEKLQISVEELMTVKGYGINPLEERLLREGGPWWKL